MRIVKPDAISVMRDGYYTLIESQDTIEITDAEWDEIGLDWINHHSNMYLSKYLKVLISLAGEQRK